MSFGLALGLMVALAVYLRGTGRDDSDAPPAAVAASRRAPEADAPRESPSPAARFDFYEVLPQFEVVIPEVESAPRSTAPARTVEEPGRYVLQVGSFTEEADADRRRANLALLGIESHIQRVTIDDDVFHRVRIGPLENLTELNRVRTQLRAARVDSLLIKIPD